MRHIIELKDGWQFTNLDGQTSEVSIPHTWNAIDGQDGGVRDKNGIIRADTGRDRSHAFQHTVYHIKPVVDIDHASVCLNGTP